MKRLPRLRDLHPRTTRSALLALVLGLASLVFGALACGTDSAGPSPTQDAGVDGPTEVSVEGGAEASVDASDATPGIPDASDATPGIPTCSAAGWCIEPLPETNLGLVDLWPLPSRAFAIGNTTDTSLPGPGFKILEWTAATKTWSYIDDNSQNQPNYYPFSIWAPNDNEVYFTVLDLSPSVVVSGIFKGYVYHGTRPAPPVTRWPWTRWEFDCDAYDFPRVWGTGNDDVYVSSCAGLYRLTGGAGPDAGTLDAGAEGGVVLGNPAWNLEYRDTSFGPVFWMTGTGPADVWFMTARGQGGGSGPGDCTFLMHKTPAGYQVVGDGIPKDNNVDPNALCADKPGFRNIHLRMDQIQIDVIHATAQNEFVGILNQVDLNVPGSPPRDSIVKMSADGDGGFSTTTSTSAPTSAFDFQGVWGSGANDLWFVASNYIVSGKNVWVDGGTYGISTIARGGAPNDRPLKEIRGTSNANIWAIGQDHVYHFPP